MPNHVMNIWANFIHVLPLSTTEMLTDNGQANGQCTDGQTDDQKHDASRRLQLVAEA